MSVQTIEKIQTGLTPNYLPNWTLSQALKEAVQNIAYGTVKSGKPAKIYFDSKTNRHVIRDFYTGLEKKHLYIGESGQRDDSQGLGNFGEGWKIFLLIMAREEIEHEVRTVGFTFSGTLEKTEHDTEVLVINVVPNDNQKGTKVSVNLGWDDVEKATRSFAILQGIDPQYINTDSIIPDRKKELWVSGVRIEDRDNTNPLNLMYSYNLRHRDLINRDRSHPNAELAYREVRQLIYDMPEEMIREYVVAALEGKGYQDVVRGPYVPISDTSGQKKIWLQVLGELHNCHHKKLVIPSSNPAINDEAKQQDYTLLDTPSQWNSELSYLGIKKADEVIEDRYDVVETGYSYSFSETKGKTPFAKAKLKLKKALDLNSVDQLPEFRYVEKIAKAVDNYNEIFCLWDESTEVIYVDISIMEDEKLLIKYMLREAVKWYFQVKNSWDVHEKYEDMLLRLL